MCLCSLVAPSISSAQATEPGEPSEQPTQPSEPGLLEQARAALDAEQPERAIELASAYTEQSPQDADGWTVLGLGYFELGELRLAVQHFDRALALLARPEDARAAAVVRFNRASCAFELGELAEAERDFVAAGLGQPAPLSVLAAVNAGFAALGQGKRARAREHLVRADALDAADALQPARDELRRELEQASGGSTATEQAPEPGPDAPQSSEGDGARSAYQAGIEAYRKGQRRRATRLFRRARSAGLDAVRDENAEAYLDALAGGLRAVGRGWGGQVSLAIGYDSNVAQSGIGDATAPLSFDLAERGSPLLMVRAELGYGYALSNSEFLLFEYDFEQLAYTQGELDVFNSQDHALELGVEHSARQWLRLGLAGRGLYTVAGLADFQALSATLGGEGWATLDYAEHFETTLRATLLTTRAIADAFSFLEGSRVEAGVDQRYRRGRLRAAVGVRYRSEGLGTQHVVTTDACVLVDADACNFIYEIPLGYHGPGLHTWLSLRLSDWMRVSARAAAEWRVHDAPMRLDVVTLGGRTGILQERLQRDRRLGIGGGLTFDLGGAFELYAGYQLNAGASNVDNTAGEGHELDYGNLNYTRQLVELEVGAQF